MSSADLNCGDTFWHWRTLYDENKIGKCKFDENEFAINWIELKFWDIYAVWDTSAVLLYFDNFIMHFGTVSRVRTDLIEAGGIAWKIDRKTF